MDKSNAQDGVRRCTERRQKRESEKEEDREGRADMQLDSGQWCSTPQRHVKGRGGQL